MGVNVHLFVEILNRYLYFYQASGRPTAGLGHTRTRSR